MYKCKYCGIKYEYIPRKTMYEYCSRSHFFKKGWESRDKDKQREIARNNFSGEKQSKRLEKLWEDPEYAAAHHPVATGAVAGATLSINEMWSDPERAKERCEAYKRGHENSVLSEDVIQMRSENCSNRNKENWDSAEWRQENIGKIGWIASHCKLEYNNKIIKFRSKSERSMFLILERANLGAIYEPEVFNGYLPDFYVPKYNRYIEIHFYDDISKEERVKNSGLDVVWFHPYNKYLKEFREVVDINLISEEAVLYVTGRLQAKI